MMRNIILPDKIGSRRLFSLRRLSIMMQENAIRGAVVALGPKKSTIEKLLEFQCDKENLERLDEWQQENLKSLVLAAEKIDEIALIIPTTMTIIKELDIPFIDPKKIRMVVPFEVEPLLPFGLEEAIVDFAIIRSNKELQSSQVLAVAIRKQDLQNILEPYEKAGIKVHRVVIDLFATYGLYQRIPTYHNLPGSAALVDIGIQGTRITFLQNNQLKLTRYIAKGLGLIVNHIAEEAAITQEEVTLHLMENGINLTDIQMPLDKICQKHFMNFFNEIQFTLNSFSLKLNYYDGVSKIFLVGKAGIIPNLLDYSTTLLQIPTEAFNPKRILEISNIQNKATDEIMAWENFINPLGASLGTQEFEDFNLRRDAFALFDENIAVQQAVVFICLILATFIGISAIGYKQINALRQAAHKLEQDQISNLKGLLPTKERSKKTTLKALSKKIEDVIKEKQTLWAPFNQERTKPLEILLELTKTFNKKQYLLEIEDLSLSEKNGSNPIIELDGYFRSEKGLGSHHKEWAELEERIKESPLLSFVEPPSPIPAAEKGIKFNVKLEKKKVEEPA